MKPYLVQFYLGASSAYGAGVTGRNIYNRKKPKEQVSMTSPKMLDTYVPTTIGFLTGALVGPFLLPIMAGMYIKENFYNVVKDVDVRFVPK